MEVALFEIICLVTAVVSVSSQSIPTPGDVLAGRPFTLGCKITRPASDRNITTWYHSYNQNACEIYSSRECTPSIHLSSKSPDGLSGGCQHLNGEEVYTVTIQNVTENTGRVKWICQYNGQEIDVTLDVIVPVTRLTLTNPPDTVLAGKPINVTCVTSASKPQACIRAYIRRSGNVRELDPRACNQDSSLVQNTTRTLTFTARAEENGAELYCNASNSVTDPPVQSQVYTINVQYHPQSGVRLSGYVNNTPVESGETLTLTCQVGQGNPQPALSWSSECGQTNTVPRNDGSQQISIIITVSPSLNQKTCVCKGSQDGALTGWMGKKSRTFNVSFGPDSVQLRADSEQSGNTVTENSNVTLTCTSGESNPAAVLTWYNNSNAIAAGEISEVSSPPGPNHGYLTTQRYKVRVDRYQDGNVIRCETQGPGNRSSKRLSSNFTLNVTYEPRFTSCKSSYIFVENETIELSCTTWAKPEPTISWSRGAQPSGLSVTNHRYTSVIRISKVNRTDSGAYTVTARNGVGRGLSRTVNVTVYYAPNVSVVLVSGENVTEGNSLQLECRAEAVPQNYTYSVWNRTIGDRPVPLVNNNPRKSLSISQVTFTDQGVYRCGASNGFGGVQGGQLEVRVRARPKFLEEINQQAAALGENIKLMLKFVSYPVYVNITWYKVINGTAENLTVSNSSGSKYRSRVTDANHTFLFDKTHVQLSGHVAELEISDVQRDDIGEYKFVAENDVGSSETIMSLNLIDRPCPPTLTTTFCDNRMANVTWISCFDGGSTQTFKLKYKKRGGNWVEIPDNITDPGEGMAVSEVVEGLQERGEYSFRVHGVNRWNKSDTVETSCTVTVSTVPPDTTSALAGPLAGGISGAIVLAGVVFLVVVILRRRKQENSSSGETEKMRPDASNVQSTTHCENVTGTESPANEHETTASVDHTGDYEDVDLIPSSSPSGPPVYAEVNKPETAPKPTKVSGQPAPVYADVNKVQKTNQIAKEQAAPVYAEVKKPRKTGEAAKAPEGPVYAEVNKTQKKANEETGAFRKAKGIFKPKPGKPKGKPTPADKTGLINGKKKDGNGKTTVDTFANAAFTGDEVMYNNFGEVGRMEPSGRPNQMEGLHDLVYADMDFVDTQPTMHPAENTTTYASIAFGQVGPPVVYDSDEEDGHPNSS